MSCPQCPPPGDTDDIDWVGEPLARESGHTFFGEMRVNNRFSICQNDFAVVNYELDVASSDSAGSSADDPAAVQESSTIAGLKATNAVAQITKLWECKANNNKYVSLLWVYNATELPPGMNERLKLNDSDFAFSWQPDSERDEASACCVVARCQPTAKEVPASQLRKNHETLIRLVGKVRFKDDETTFKHKTQRFLQVPWTIPSYRPGHNPQRTGTATNASHSRSTASKRDASHHKRKEERRPSSLPWSIPDDLSDHPDLQGLSAASSPMSISPSDVPSQLLAQLTW